MEIRQTKNNKRGLFIVCGINASGKDTLAREIAKSFSHPVITSESRLILYGLGLIPFYAAGHIITTEQYKTLENTPQKAIDRIICTSYRSTLISLAKDNLVLLLYHLVFALNIDRKKPQFLTEKKIPSWLCSLSSGWMHIKSSGEEVLKRRRRDSKTTERDRGKFMLNDIIVHQRLCDERWRDINHNHPTGKYITLYNKQGELQIVASKAIEFINNNSLPLKHK